MEVTRISWFSWVLKEEWGVNMENFGGDSRAIVLLSFCISQSLCPYYWCQGHRWIRQNIQYCASPLECTITERHKARLSSPTLLVCWAWLQYLHILPRLSQLSRWYRSSFTQTTAEVSVKFIAITVTRPNVITVVDTVASGRLSANKHELCNKEKFLKSSKMAQLCI